MTNRILLADDSITIQKVVGLTFASEPYELDVVDNGDDAFTQIRDNPPAILLADTDMPGLNGFDLCQKVKEEVPGVHVIRLYNTYEVFDTDRAAEVKADYWSPKPFDADTLLEKIRGFISSPASAEEPAAIMEDAEPEEASFVAVEAEEAMVEESNSDGWDSPGDGEIVTRFDEADDAGLMEEKEVSEFEGATSVEEVETDDLSDEETADLMADDVESEEAEIQDAPEVVPAPEIGPEDVPAVATESDAGNADDWNLGTLDVYENAGPGAEADTTEDAPATVEEDYSTAEAPQEEAELDMDFGSLDQEEPEEPAVVAEEASNDSLDDSVDMAADETVEAHEEETQAESPDTGDEMMNEFESFVQSSSDDVEPEVEAESSEDLMDEFAAFEANDTAEQEAPAEDLETSENAAEMDFGGLDEVAIEEEDVVEELEEDIIEEMPEELAEEPVEEMEEEIVEEIPEVPEKDEAVAAAPAPSSEISADAIERAAQLAAGQLEGLVDQTVRKVVDDVLGSKLEELMREAVSSAVDRVAEEMKRKFNI